MNRTKYINRKQAKRLHLESFPSAGPNANIKGTREMFWGNDAYILKHGAYIYKVPHSVFYNTEILY